MVPSKLLDNYFLLVGYTVFNEYGISKVACMKI